MADQNELRRAVSEARAAVDDLEKELARAIAVVRQLFAARMEARLIVVARAQTALNQAIADAGVSANADMPTYILYEWKKDSRSRWESGPTPYKLTGRTGRYEVRTTESVFATTAWQFRLGERFIRVLKKNGAPGLRFEVAKRWGAKWLPKGEDPNQNDADADARAETGA